MREDHMETLDKMYPSGYLIIYTCEDGQIRYGKYNPKHVRLINEYEHILTEGLRQGEPPAQWEEGEEPFDPDEGESWKGGEDVR